MPQAARGEAVVADADRARCDVLGRVLANAGYSVRYATDLVSARYYLSKPSVTLFVLNEELGSPSTLLEEAQTLRCGAKWVIAAKQRRLMEVRDALKSLQAEDGHWVFELEADCTIPAEYVLLTHYRGEAVDTALERKIAANPNDFQARYDLAEALSARGDLEGASEQLLAALHVPVVAPGSVQETLDLALV